ncbi:MAG: cobalamin-dependent protein [Clostridium sp.]|uniref:cobalamin B12-binding domain-containing protein n=1 Tax=Clostridium sp. TaxID=1506 RepID=UPI002FCAC762
MHPLLQKISDCVVNMDDDIIEEAVLEAIKEDSITIEEIYNKGLNDGMQRAVKLYDEEEYFIPEIIVCSDTLNLGIDTLRQSGLMKKETKGKVVLAVVKGDTHDIGKNIVGIMLEASGYEVIDLGSDCHEEDILEATINHNADIVGLSSMMTTTMRNMESVVNLFKSKSLNTPIIIGGGPITSEFANEIGATGYSSSGPEAVKLVNTILHS